jgi:hypothetical protein
MSLSLNMTAGKDNQVVWIIRISIDESTVFYLSDADDKITLSSQDYDGKVIQKDSIGTVSNSADFSGVGSVSNFTFGIARYNELSGLSNFFNDLFPATSGDYLIGATVEFGIVWNTATTESQITWLNTFYIEDYEYVADYMTLFCVAIDELQNKQIPYYEIQSDYDDGISYFDQAPADSYGAFMPILYGDAFIAETFLAYMNETVYRAPTIVVDESKMKVVVSYHKCYGTSLSLKVSGEYSLFRYLNGLKTYQQLYRADGTAGSNNFNGHNLSMLDTQNDLLYGASYIKLRVLSPLSDLKDVGNITNPALSDYEELDGQKGVALRPGREESESNFGFLQEANTSDIQLKFQISSDSVNNRDWTLYLSSILENPTWSSATGVSGTHALGTTTATITFNMASDHPAGINWTIERLLATEFRLGNDEASSSDKIRVYYAWIYCENINVLGVSRNQKIITLQQRN